MQLASVLSTIGKGWFRDKICQNSEEREKKPLQKSTRFENFIPSVLETWISIFEFKSLGPGQTIKHCWSIIFNFPWRTMFDRQGIAKIHQWKC